MLPFFSQLQIFAKETRQTSKDKIKKKIDFILQVQVVLSINLLTTAVLFHPHTPHLCSFIC